MPVRPVCFSIMRRPQASGDASRNAPKMPLSFTVRDRRGDKGSSYGSSGTASGRAR